MSAPAQAPGFRNYGAGARAAVHELYRQNHTLQTLDFVRAQKRKYLTRDRRRMTAWEALELVETLVDDSDPDIELGQIDLDACIGRHRLQLGGLLDAAHRAVHGVALLSEVDCGSAAEAAVGTGDDGDGHCDMVRRCV